MMHQNTMLAVGRIVSLDDRLAEILSITHPMISGMETRIRLLYLDTGDDILLSPTAFLSRCRSLIIENPGPKILETYGRAKQKHIDENAELLTILQRVSELWRTKTLAAIHAELTRDKLITVSLRTLYRWVRRFEDGHTFIRYDFFRGNRTPRYPDIEKKYANFLILLKKSKQELDITQERSQFQFYLKHDRLPSLINSRV